MIYHIEARRTDHPDQVVHYAADGTLEEVVEVLRALGMEVVKVERCGLSNASEN